MSSDEIIHILRQLYELGCPSEILGCNPSKSDEKEVSNVIETGCNLLLQPSQDKLELLKWIDSQIFSDITAKNLDTSNKKHLAGHLNPIGEVKDHLSCLISADSDGLFGQGSQVTYLPFKFFTSTRYLDVLSDPICILLSTLSKNYALCFLGQG